MRGCTRASSTRRPPAAAARNGERYRHLGIDTFYRFNATIQVFFEECAAVPTHVD
jgi:hypothetical protein